MSSTEERAGTSAVMDPQSALGFLAKVSGLLAASLDYERTLREVARLAVPDVADWCGIDIVHPDGTTRQVTSVHPNPELEGSCSSCGGATARRSGAPRARPA